jgi:hypothetical protein
MMTTMIDDERDTSITKKTAINKRNRKNNNDTNNKGSDDIIPKQLKLSH